MRLCNQEGDTVQSDVAVTFSEARIFP